MVETFVLLLQRLDLWAGNLLFKIIPHSWGAQTKVGILVFLICVMLILTYILLKCVTFEDRLRLGAVFLTGLSLTGLFCHFAANKLPNDKQYFSHSFTSSMDSPAFIFLFCLLFVFFMPAYFLLRKVPKKYNWGLVTVLLLTPFLIVLYSFESRAYTSRPVVFDGNSSALSRTQIVPTLDTPIQPGKNVIWCASFQAAWKTLQNDIAKGPLQLEGADEVCTRLNESAISETPEGTLYTAAGWVQNGILDTIRQEKAARFPGSITPDFSQALENSFVMYGYLEARCKFPLSYFDNRSPLTFTDSMGKKSKIRTFGIRGEDRSKYFSLHKQVGVLVAPESIKEHPEDFVIDLCRDSKDTQVVFANVSYGVSLKEILAYIETDIEKTPKDNPREFETIDILLVPEIAYRIVHEFDALKGRPFKNESLSGQRMDIARQDVSFRLDRSGTELMSESSAIAAEACLNINAIGNKPFLLYLKKRGAALPYFVMWVDNDELLTKWE